MAESGADQEVVVFRILGPVTVEVPASDAEVAIGGRRVRSVLVTLLVDHDRWIRTDALLASVFGDDAPRSARNSLHSHLSRLRTRLRPYGVALDARRDSYRMSLAGTSVLDLDRFRDGVRSGADALDQGAVAVARRHLREALAWWRGPALAGVVDLLRLRAVAEGLEEERQRAVELWIEAELGAGNHAGVLAALRDEIARHPYRERFHAQLATALYRSGRQAEALGVLRRLEATLAEELGLVPNPELRDLERRILAHDRSLRPGEAGVARTDGGHARRGSSIEPPVRPAGERLPFVGRQAELDRLGALARAAGAGQSPVVVIEGEAGAGKSRLAGEALARLGAPVLRARCSPDLGITYEPFIDILADLDGGAAPRCVTDALARGAADLAPLRAGSPHDQHPHRPPDLEDHALGQYRLFTALHAVLAAALDGGGALLVEDIHWASAPTIGALRFVTTKRPLPGCLVVLTRRPDEPSPPPELAALLTDLRRARRLVPLVLGPLTEDDLATLVGPPAEPGASAGGVRWLRRQTGGLPLLVEIALPIARRAVAGGVVASSGTLAKGALAEGTVRCFTAERMSRVSAATRETLARCAVIGSTVDVSVLEAIDRNAGVLDDLQTLSRAGLLREEAVDRFDFAHELTRAAVLAELGTSRVARLHEEVAVALQAVHGDAATVADRLATHWLAAVRPGTELAAATAVCRAAQLAITRVSPNDARRWARAGLDLLPSTGAPAELEADLCLALANASFALGDHVTRIEAAERAARAAQIAGDPRRRAHAALIRGAAWWNGVADSGALTLLVGALEGLGHTEADADAVLRVHLLGTLAGLVSVSGVDSPLDARELAEEAVRRGRRMLAAELPGGGGQSLGFGRTPAAEAHARALGALIVISADGPFVREQLRAADEIVALGGRHHDRYLTAVGVRFRASRRLVLGDRAGFEADLAELATFAFDVDFHEYGAQVELWRAQLALLDGRLSDVEEASRRSVELSPGNPNLALSQQTQMLWLARERGQLGGVADVLAAAAEANPSIASLRAHLALCAVDTDRFDLAREQLDRLARDGFAGLRRDTLWVTSIAALIEVAVSVGDRERAVALAALLDPYAGQLAVVAIGTLCIGAVDRFVALAIASTGDLPAARRRFAAALDLERAVAAAPLMAWTRFWWGSSEIHDDPAVARQLLTTAADAARGYGGGLLIRRAEQALARL